MIKDLDISQVYNAAKEKTIKISMRTEKGTFYACAGSGTSAGIYETRKVDRETIIKNFPETKKRFIGKNERNADKIIEGIGIGNIGANLSINISVASIRAVSKNNVYSFINKKARAFPYPIGNVIGGGAHKGYTSEQEFLVLPAKAKDIREAVKVNQLIWSDVGKHVNSKKISLGNNLEGAWMCKLNDIETLDFLSKKAEEYEARIGIDFASSEIYRDGRYCYLNPERSLLPEEQLEFVLDLIKTYKLIYVEDPFHENDFDHFAELTQRAGCLVVGDDLFATQPERLNKGIEKKAGNAVIIKPDQAGLVSKTLETARIAKKANYKTVVSHRSRDTTDSFIADLAVGIESPIIKCGIHGKERASKLNRLIDIWKKVKKPEMAKLNFL